MKNTEGTKGATPIPWDGLIDLSKYPKSGVTVKIVR
jgi:hypothetical protein